MDNEVFMKENAIRLKSFEFALRIVKLSKHLMDEKENL